MANFQRYLMRRFITLIPTVFGVVFLVFSIGYIMPADLARAWAGGIKAKKEFVEEIARKYHLDLPFLNLFYFFLVGILTNTLESPTLGVPIFTVLMALFPFTAQLAIMSMLIAVLIGFPIGILAAYKKDTKIDYLLRLWIYAMNAMPIFFLGCLMKYLAYNVYDVIGYKPSEYLKLPSRKIIGLPLIDAIILGEVDVFFDLFLRFFWPSLTLGLIYAAVIARFVRAALLDVFGAEFMLFLTAKGVSSKRELLHAFRHALIPIITVIGYSFASLLGGAVIVEIIFHLPGIGSLLYYSLFIYDVVVILGTTLFFAIIVVLTSFIIDIIYGIIDPRIRY